MAELTVEPAGMEDTSISASLIWMLILKVAHNFLNVIQAVLNELALANDRARYDQGNLQRSSKRDTTDVLRFLKEKIEQDREGRGSALEARRSERTNR